MDQLIPTMRVKNPNEPGGFMVINRHDFDPSIYEPWDDEGWGAKQRAPVEGAPADDVDITGWRDKNFMSQRSLAWKIAGNKDATTGAAVAALLEAEEARRAAK